MPRLRSGLVGLCLLLSATETLAQRTGGLRVIVEDADGHRRGDVAVLLRHDAGRLPPQRERADRLGMVEFPVLAAEGRWTLRVLESERVVGQVGVQVRVDGITVVTVTLAADPQREAATVRYGALDAETATAITRFPDGFVHELPLRGRFYQQVLPLTGGVDDADGDGNPRVHGSTSRDFRAIVNGVANVDPLTNHFLNLVNDDSIDQIAVLPSGVSLQYGRAQGGFAAITQKIGGNELAFSAELRYRSSAIDGSEPSADGTGDANYRSIQPSASVSGPIVKDKLWYRLAWERLDQELPVDVLTGIAVQSRDRTIQAYQLTWQTAPRHRLALQYQTDPLEFTGFGVDSSLPVSSAQRVDIDNRTLSLTYSLPWSSRLLLETTAAWSERDTTIEPQTSGVANDCVGGIEPLPTSLCAARGNRTSGSSFRTVDATTERGSLVLRGTWHAGQLAGVAHRLRFGGSMEEDRFDRLLQSGVRSYLLPSAPYLATFSLEPDQPGRVESTNAALWLEDSLRPARNLVIDFGLRLDREEIDTHGSTAIDPVAEAAAFTQLVDAGELTIDEILRTGVFTAADAGRFARAASELFGIPLSSVIGSLSNIQRQSAFWPTKRGGQDVVIRNTNWSPTLAVSWDPWNDGRNKFAASARRYYGTLPLAIPLLDQDQPTATMGFDTSVDIFGDLVVVGLANNVNPALDITQVDDALKTPYQDEWRLAYERELWRRGRLRLEYVDRDYRDQLRVEDLNNRAGDFGRCRIATFPDRRSLVVSPGSGFEITDPYTGETYVDTDPGDGDGRIDDCVGRTEVVDFFTRQVPDGTPDPYAQNPAWGSIHQVTNGGRRDYEAFVVELTRRQFAGWGLQASYVWSRFEGNGEPFEAYLGVDPLALEPRFGAESDDQRHALKVAATGRLRGDWQLGGIVTWQSGLPYSLVEYSTVAPSLPPDYSAFGAPTAPRVRIVYDTDERNTERNDAYWLADVRIAKGFDLGQRARLEVGLDVFNLFDDDTLQVYNPDTEIGLQFGGIASARRRFGRSFQLGLRVTGR